MIGAIIPPGTSLTVEQLKQGGFFSKYFSKEIARSVIPSLLGFLRETKFTPSVEAAKAYFALHDIAPIAGEDEAACAELIEKYAGEMEYCFEVNFRRKMMLLVKVMQCLCDENHGIRYRMQRHMDILRDLIDLRYIGPAGKNLNAVSRVDSLLIKARAKFNKSFNEYNDAGVHRQMADIAVVREKEVKDFLDMLMAWSDTTRVHDRQSVSLFISTMEILHMCLWDDDAQEWYWHKRTDEASMHAYRDIITRLLYVDNGEKRHRPSIDKTLTDVDPVALVYMPCAQAEIVRYLNLDKALLQPGYRRLLEWHVVEAVVLRSNIKAMKLDAGIESEDGPKEACDDE